MHSECVSASSQYEMADLLGKWEREEQRKAQIVDRNTPKGDILAVRCEDDEIFSFYPAVAMEAGSAWEDEDSQVPVQWLDTSDHDPQSAESSYYPESKDTIDGASIICRSGNIRLSPQ